MGQLALPPGSTDTTELEAPRRRRFRPSAKTLGVVVPGLVIAALISAQATYAAFTSTKTYPGISVAAGTVTFTGDDPAGFAVTLSNMKPGDFAERCVSLTYTGSIAPDVRLYATSTANLAPYLDLTVTKASAAVDTTGGSCANFVDGSATTVSATGLLSAFPATYAASTVTENAPTWAQNQTRSYKVRLALRDDNLAQGKSTVASFSWEARSV